MEEKKSVKFMVSEDYITENQAENTQNTTQDKDTIKTENVSVEKSTSKHSKLAGYTKIQMAVDTTHTLAEALEKFHLKKMPKVEFKRRTATRVKTKKVNAHKKKTGLREKDK